MQEFPIIHHWFHKDPKDVIYPDFFQSGFGFATMLLENDIPDQRDSEDLMNSRQCLEENANLKAIFDDKDNYLCNFPSLNIEATSSPNTKNKVILPPPKPNPPITERPIPPTKQRPISPTTQRQVSLIRQNAISIPIHEFCRECNQKKSWCFLPQCKRLREQNNEAKPKPSISDAETKKSTKRKLFCEPDEVIGGEILILNEDSDAVCMSCKKIQQQKLKIIEKNILQEVDKFDDFNLRSIFSTITQTIIAGLIDN
jgi:hypothetical protein